MGNHIDVVIPIFIAEKVSDTYICCKSGKQYRVAVGKEQGCSYYTNVAIIEAANSEDISNDQIEQLRRDLCAALKESNFAKNKC